MVIPSLRADYLCITHPFATNKLNFHRSFQKIYSFDLHVLGTPLAFILSQDQTQIGRAHV